MSIINESVYRGPPVYEKAWRLLIREARAKRFMNYAPLFNLLKLKRGNHAARQAGQLLGEISEDTYRAGLPMLSAIVINTTTNRPGPGFFTLAQQLGIITKWRSETH